MMIVSHRRFGLPDHDRAARTKAGMRDRFPQPLRCRRWSTLPGKEKQQSPSVSRKKTGEQSVQLAVIGAHPHHTQGERRKDNGEAAEYWQGLHNCPNLHMVNPLHTKPAATRRTVIIFPLTAQFLQVTTWVGLLHPWHAQEADTLPQ
jgi:hypothetical protein